MSLFNEIGSFNLSLADISIRINYCYFLYDDKYLEAILLKCISCQQKRDPTIENCKNYFGFH